jgi:dephospho-CoA kinase
VSAKDKLIERASDLGWTIVKTDDWIRHFYKAGVEVYVEFDARGGIIYAHNDALPGQRSLRRSDKHKLDTVFNWLGVN